MEKLLELIKNGKAIETRKGTIYSLNTTYTDEQGNKYKVYALINNGKMSTVLYNGVAVIEQNESFFTEFSKGALKGYIWQMI